MKKTENNITELVFILDRSGSMYHLTNDTVGGFNSLIDKQKKEDGTCYVSTVLFNDRSEVLYDRVPLSEVRSMTEADFDASGCTALIDAIGGAIHHIGNVHKYARPEDVPQNTLFVIMTDGYENASHQYSSTEVKKLIEKQKEKYGWEFLFLGANIDAVETAKHFGISQEFVADYVPDSAGTGIVYEELCKNISSIRSDACLASTGLDNIRKDHKTRAKKK